MRRISSVWRLRSRKYEQRNVVQLRDTSRTISTSFDAILRHGVEPASKSFQKQIINALQLGEKGKASNLLQDLSHEKQSLRADDFVDILKYCARSIDPLFALETWKIMQQSEVNPNDKCYLHIIRALCSGGYAELELASKMIKNIGESDSNQSISFYNTFLRACFKALNMDLLGRKNEIMGLADQCLDMMARRMVGKNEVTYLALLELAARQEDHFAVHEIWKDYVKYYPLNFLSLRKFIWSFTILKDLKSACQALQYVVSLFLRENTFSTDSAEGTLFSSSSRLDIPIPFCGENGEKFNLNGDQQLFSSLANIYTEEPRSTTSFGFNKSVVESVGIDELAGKNLPMETIRLSFSYAIHACALTRNSRLAEQLMVQDGRSWAWAINAVAWCHHYQQMLKLGVRPSSYTYDGFVKAMVRGSGFSAGIKLLKIMEKMDLKPSDSTLAAISIGCSKALELDIAKALLDQVSDCPYPHPYNAFLAACSKADQPNRGLQMLAKMKQFNVQPDNVTYKQLFALFSTVNAPYESGDLLSMGDSAERIKNIEMDMARSGVQHSRSSMINMLKGLGAEGMTGELIYNLKRAVRIFCRTGSYTGTSFYNTVLHSLVEANESQMAIDVYQDMRLCGFLPDAATYAIMFDCCSHIPCYRSASALFSLMLRDGFPPQACHYTSLLKVLLKSEDMNEALNTLDQWKLDESQLDVIFYNTIIEQAWVQGRIDVIEFVVEEMYRNKVQPDSTTCRYVFTAYLGHGFHNTAVEALQVLSLRMISGKDDKLQQMREELDDIIHSEDTHSELQMLKFFTNYEERTAVALLNLRWCALAGFSISWFPNQTAWARRLAANYNSRVRIT